MEVDLPKPGKYVLAVSGGVDSMVLFDILARHDGIEMVVGHVDHGIRTESSRDRQFVQHYAHELGLVFEYCEAELGPNASEAKAREVRYKFLNEIKAKHKARAIITAHHQDDVLETAILNLLRGTGRKGLSSLSSRQNVMRPLLNITKAELIDYAKQHSLDWHEDPTNQDTKYLRNYIRKNIISKINLKQRRQLLEIINSTKKVNDELDTLLVKCLSNNRSKQVLDRNLIDKLSHDAGLEILATWFRQCNVPFDRQAVERVLITTKTFMPAKRVDVSAGWYVLIQKDKLALEHRER